MEIGKNRQGCHFHGTSRPDEVRRKPAPGDSMACTVVKGHVCKVTDEVDGWCYGCCLKGQEPSY